jgi:serine/threonine-protein kinase RsbW
MIAVEELRNVSSVKTYQGKADTVREVRRDVREMVGACPEVIAEDAVLIASELATNAVKHSRSGDDGGTYAVRVSHFAAERIPYVWIEVDDGGNPSWDGVLRSEPTHGLSVIEGLSTWMGTEDRPQGRRAVFARLQYRPDGTPLYGTGTAPELHPDLAGIRDSEV